MKNLQEAIKNREPIEVYLDNEHYDTFYYNEKENIYQGEFGFMPMDTVTKVLLRKEEVNHIKTEGRKNET